MGLGRHQVGGVCQPIDIHGEVQQSSTGVQSGQQGFWQMIGMAAILSMHVKDEHPRR